MSSIDLPIFSHKFFYGNKKLVGVGKLFLDISIKIRILKFSTKVNGTEHCMWGQCKEL